MFGLALGWGTALGARLSGSPKSRPEPKVCPPHTRGSRWTPCASGCSVQPALANRQPPAQPVVHRRGRTDCALCCAVLPPCAPQVWAILGRSATSGWEEQVNAPHSVSCICSPTTCLPRLLVPLYLRIIFGSGIIKALSDLVPGLPNTVLLMIFWKLIAHNSPQEEN